MGHISRTDFGSIGGLPKGGQTTFNPVRSGTYMVNPDCTGTMKVVYNAGGSVPAGVETDLNIVVAADGTLVESVVCRAVIPSSATTADGSTCSASCEQGVQNTLKEKRFSSTASADPDPDGCTMRMALAMTTAEFEHLAWSFRL